MKINRMKKYLKNKKAEFPVIKTVVILIVSVVILLTYTIDLASNKINFDDNKINTQVTLNKIFNSKCIFKNYGIIEENEFNQKRINSCFNSNKNVLVKLLIPLDMKNNVVYLGSKDEFDFDAQLCNMKSSILCSKLIYPIILKNSKNEQKNTQLFVYVIAH